MSPLAVSFASLGYAIIPDVFPPDVVLQICSLVERGRTSAQGDEAVANNSGVYALRNLTDVIPELATILLQPVLTRIVEDVLGQDSFVTRATLFDKTVGANWGVFWHQDLSIAVQEKHDVPGFGAWTRKAGVISVQPPLELMSRILAVRIHLDSCTRQNGALRVLPGTHLLNRLGTERVEEAVRNELEVICEAPSGGVVLMNPLTLHSSLPMESAEHRRVIHLEFANFDLPAPLEWRYRVK